jgi:cyclopropane-fatty-acyl-phospholipid synthase
MKALKLKNNIAEILSQAGISINGTNPWDINVYNEQFYTRALAEGVIGIGEAYVENWWDSPHLDEFFERVIAANLESRIENNWKLLLEIFLTRVFNRQSHSRAFFNGQKHYDLGNDLFEVMLDKRLVYTCGFWKNAETLDQAQEAKLDLTCRKLYLEPGMTILDIGCGWGSFAKYAAENFDVKVTGITVSKEQTELGNKLCKGLPVEIKLMDYRDLDGKYDRIVSLGMFEHVGYKNYRTYMNIANRNLKDDGLFLLHTIGSSVSKTYSDPWMDKYIFPGSLLPSITQIGKAIEGLFVMENWENFSADYDKTLVAWHDNFVSGWDEIKMNYDDRFYRTWKYYLLMCAGSFRARKNQLWQIVLSKKGLPGGYVAPALH